MSSISVLTASKINAKIGEFNSLRSRLLLAESLDSPIRIYKEYPFQQEPINSNEWWIIVLYPS
jgi:hypothetical protein